MIQIQDWYIKNSLKNFKQRGLFKFQAKKQLAKIGFNYQQQIQIMNDAEDMLVLEILCK